MSIIAEAVLVPNPPAVVTRVQVPSPSGLLSDQLAGTKVVPWKPSVNGTATVAGGAVTVNELVFESFDVFRSVDPFGWLVATVMVCVATDNVGLVGNVTVAELPEARLPVHA